MSRLHENIRSSTLTQVLLVGARLVTSVLLARALGPLLRGTLWETIAVPELRGQARVVAETILERPPHYDTMPPEVQMEYSI